MALPLLLMEILLSGYSVQTTLPNSHPAALWFICIYIWHAQSERVLTGVLSGTNEIDLELS